MIDVNGIFEFLNMMIMMIIKINDIVYHLYMFMYDIIKFLDNDVRLDAYIGVTGVLVAIVIFTAEFTFNQKHNIYKKVIITKSKIVKNIGFMIFILALSWFITSIDSKNYNIYYFLSQVFLNICIINSMFCTYRLFKLIIIWNYNIGELNKIMDNYIIDETVKAFNINISKKEISDIKIEYFDKYLNESEYIKYNLYFEDDKNEYKKLYLKDEKYIVDINYDLLTKISESNQLNVTTNYEEITKSSIINDNNQDVAIILAKKIGDIIDKHSPILFYKNINTELASELPAIFKLDHNPIYSYDNIVDIINNLFSMAMDDKLNFDNNSRLLNYYTLLCEKKIEHIRNLFINVIDNYYYEAIKNEQFNISYSRFLNRLIHIAYKYKEYNNFKTFTSYLNGCYYNRIVENTDYKQIAYDYSKTSFRYYLYSSNKNIDYKYYDISLASLLQLINQFVKICEFEAIFVLFDNIYFDEYNITAEVDFDEINIAQFQFLIGIFSSILYNYDKFKEEEFLKIKKLIEILKYRFFDFYDVSDFILKFQKYYKYNSQLYEKYDNWGFDVVDHKYKTSWTGYSIDELEVLKLMLYSFTIDFENIDDCILSKIERNNKYFYNNLLTKFSTNNYPLLEKYLDYESYNKVNVISVLNKFVAICKKLDDEYEKSEKLSKIKISQFENRIRKFSEKEIGIMPYIVFDKTNKKLKKVFGINQIIPRNIFFEDVIGMENIADNYGLAFPKGINKEIIDKIVKNITISKNTLEEEIAKLKNLEDYIIICSNHTLYNAKLKREKDCIKIKDKIVEVIIENTVNGFILTNKKQLPSVSICEFPEEYNVKNIKNNLFFELLDCSENEKLRMEIISKSKWLAEKGNIDEQNEYLKKHCILKIYKSYFIKSKKDIKYTMIES